MWDEDSRELYKSRVEATLGHVLWSSGQCQIPQEQEGMQGEVRRLRPLERCGGAWAVLGTAVSVLGRADI